VTVSCVLNRITSQLYLMV